ncbi:MAG: hypothetical protein O7D97_05040 [Planctomycetota bacterium]|nr:hypothetical protein [Planctomycetota bacterium]MCZ6492982.1 hypothetical protein [Planctomycetota bacterium]MCZ6651797.1 hypothetical protein [Planctomycetota bacterium]MCZ6735470.1 hypothetical protein [Planctomycetota bacterium]MCZ6811349.1 hypothetical protein [Planctomycetota bacterium]
MALTIRNDILRRGELWFGLQVAFIWAILAGLCAAGLVVGRWGESISAEDWWTGLALAGGLALLSAFVFVKAPRQLLRLSDSAFQVVTLGLRRCRRLRFPWMEVEGCLFTDHRMGISTGNHRIELYRQSFTKDDWERLRQEVRSRLDPSFDFKAPTDLERRGQRQRAWPLWRKLVDKLVLVGAAMTFVCPILVFAALGRSPDQLNSVLDGLALAASLTPVGIVVVLILRHSRSLGHERWHRRSSGSSAPH